MKHLALSSTLSLPLEAVTQKFAVLGTSGAGKTYGSLRLAELMLAVGAQIVALDPVGNWYSLRLGAEGRGKGFSIPVFGGLRGDLPLESGAGALIAKVIVEKGISAVLDVHLMRKHQRKEFVTAFAEELFHLKKEHRSPVHLFLEEAQSFVPQKIFKGEERMLGAFEDLTKIGRNYGIGWTIISQRPQAVNKDALNLAGTLFVFRTIGKHERKAIEDWIEEKDLDLEKVVKTLPSLPDGACYCWSPEFLHVFKQVKISRRVTFDASATPKVGEKPLKPRELSRMDVAELREALKSVVQKVESEDPKVLRRRVADLEHQLTVQAKSSEIIRPAPKIRRIEVPILGPREAKRIERAAEAITNALPILKEAGERLRAGMTEKKVGPVENLVPVIRLHTGASVKPFNEISLKPRSRQESRQNGGNGEDARLGKAERLILSVLAQYKQGRTVTQVALLTGYAVGGGAFRNPLGKLRTAGFVDGGRGDTLRITPEGRAAIEGHWKPLPAPGQDLLDYWMRRLGHAERQIVRVLAEAYPKSLTASEVAERTSSSKGTPYEADGGAFRNPLGRLRTLELVVGRGNLRISDTLMETT